MYKSHEYFWVPDIEKKAIQIFGDLKSILKRQRKPKNNAANKERKLNEKK